MNFKKQIFYGLSSALPTSILRRMVSSSPLYPYHHVVSDEVLPHIKHLYSYKNIKKFRSDLDYLLKSYTPITAGALLANIKGEKALPKNSFLLSFDDGFREVAEIIAPILLEKGVPAVIFLNPAFIDNKEMYYRCGISLLIEALIKQKSNPSVVWQCSNILQVPDPTTSAIVAAMKKITNLNQSLLIDLCEVLDVDFNEYLVNHQPFMSKQQVEFLSLNGFELGGHSWDHPYYQLLSMQEAISQTVRSCSYINENFPEKLSLFSFPHTDQGISQSFFTELSKQIQIDLFFGTQNQDDELTNKVLHRFNAERPQVTLSKQLNGLLFWMLIRKLVKANKVIRI
ncbi:polysaccharide deacetylase family protein [Flavitalea antarctica]